MDGEAGKDALEDEEAGEAGECACDTWGPLGVRMLAPGAVAFVMVGVVFGVLAEALLLLLVFAGGCFVFSLGTDETEEEEAEAEAQEPFAAVGWYLDLVEADLAPFGFAQGLRRAQGYGG